jgi:hypothetical protein
VESSTSLRENHPATVALVQVLAGDLDAALVTLQAATLAESEQAQSAALTLYSLAMRHQFRQDPDRIKALHAGMTMGLDQEG